MWASAHDAQRVFGIDPDTRDVAVKGEIGTGSNGIAVGFGSVWVANYSSGTVSRVDPNTGSSHEIVVGLEKTSGGGGYLAPGGPSSFAFGFGERMDHGPAVRRGLPSRSGYGDDHRHDPGREGG